MAGGAQKRARAAADDVDSDRPAASKASKGNGNAGKRGKAVQDIHDSADEDSDDDDVPLTGAAKHSKARSITANVKPQGKGKGRADSSIPEDNEEEEEEIVLKSKQAAGSSELARMQKELDQACLTSVTPEAPLTCAQERHSYKKLQSRFKSYLESEDSDLEREIADLKATSNERAEAARKSVQTYVAENTELKSSNATLEEEVRSLRAQVRAKNDQEADQTGVDDEGDVTEPDQRADATTVVPETQFAGRSQEKLLRTSSTVSEQQLQASQSANTQLEQEISDLKQQLKEAAQARKAARAEAEQALNRQAKDLNEQFAKDKKALQQAVADQQQKAEQLEKELELEVKLSKQLQAQASQPSGSQTQPTPSQTGSQAPSAAALEAEQALNKLICELVGLECLHRKAGQYSFLISDHKKRRHFHFKLIHDKKNNQLEYIPDFAQDRDDTIRKLLDPNLQTHIMFAYEAAPSFFRRLWKGINDGKK